MRISEECETVEKAYSQGDNILWFLSSFGQIYMPGFTETMKKKVIPFDLLIRSQAFY